MGVEINKPLVVESAGCRRRENRRGMNVGLAQPLLFEPLNLNDEAVLDDHPDLAELNAADRRPNLLQVKLA